MTVGELNKRMSEITDTELVALCEKEVSKLCDTGGKSFTMSVPVSTLDSDMLFCELLKRFEKSIKF